MGGLQRERRPETTPWEASTLRHVYARLPSLDLGLVVKTCPAKLAVL